MVESMTDTGLYILIFGTILMAGACIWGMMV